MALYNPDEAPATTIVRSPPLARKISLACGPLHARLNNGIMTSLPLALPPKAKDTSLYAAGLASFGMIYLTYEDLWHCVSHPPSLHDQAEDADASHAENIARFFATLRPEGIERSTRLRIDLKFLHTTDESASKHRKEGPAQRKFRLHILHALATKPHTLYAYAWCMYMAVFAGGRYIREDLSKAGKRFWRHHGHPPPDYDSDSSSGSDPSDEEPEDKESHRDDQEQNTPLISGPQSSRQHQEKTKKHHKKHPKPAPLDYPGYSFLSFPIPANKKADDGASIRDAFIKNLYAAETLFTSSEQDDVVAESKKIFELTIELVAEMAETIRPNPSTWSSSHLPPFTMASAPSPRMTPPSPPSYSAHHEPQDRSAPPPYSQSQHSKVPQTITTTTHPDPLLTQRASTPELLEWSRDPDPPRHGFVFWSKMTLLIVASMAVGWILLFGVKFWLWWLGGGRSMEGGGGWEGMERGGGGGSGRLGGQGGLGGQGAGEHWWRRWRGCRDG